MATPGNAGERKHRIANLEPGHTRSDRIDETSCVGSEDALPRTAESEGRSPHHAETTRQDAAANPPIACRHRRREDADAHFSGSGRRRGHLADLSHLRGTIAGDKSDFHGGDSKSGQD